MSKGAVEEAEHADDSHDEHGDDGAHAGHPTEAQYVKIALILAAITGAEVALYYTKFSRAATNTALILMAGTKFAIVAAYFMHLKFDNKILRRLFITGIVLASVCYIGYLRTLGVF